MLRKNRSLSFSVKQMSVRGVFSSVLGAVALVIGIVAVVMSYRNEGNAGLIVGRVGFMAWLSAFMGFLFGIGGMLESDKYRFWAGIGLLISTVLFAGLTYLFVVGLLY